jgi:hypothetical protein
MARHPTTLSDKEKQRIAKAIGSGCSIEDLHRSGRFKGVSHKMMALIADEHEVNRQRFPSKRRGVGLREVANEP